MKNNLFSLLKVMVISTVLIIGFSILIIDYLEVGFFMIENYLLTTLVEVWISAFVVFLTSMVSGKHKKMGAEVGMVAVWVLSFCIIVALLGNLSEDTVYFKRLAGEFKISVWFIYYFIPASKVIFMISTSIIIKKFMISLAENKPEERNEQIG